jgi:hypothetical protein
MKYYNMIEVAFIFRTDINPTIQYGKIKLNYLSDDHDGIDNEINPIVYESINTFMTIHSLPNITNVDIGILGVSNEWHNRCSDDEQKINIFNLYIDCSNGYWKKHTYNYNGETGLIYKRLVNILESDHKK